MTHCYKHRIGIIVNWLSSYIPRRLKITYSSSVLYEFVLSCFFKLFLFWAIWTWESIYSVEFVIHFSQILPLIVLIERDSKYIPWNLSFMSLKFFLLLGYLNVVVNILRRICPSCLSNSSSYWANWTWNQIYTFEFALHVSQILPLIGLLEGDSQYIPWNLSFMSVKFFLLMGYL